MIKKTSLIVLVGMILWLNAGAAQAHWDISFRLGSTPYYSHRFFMWPYFGRVHYPFYSSAYRRFQRPSVLFPITGSSRMSTQGAMVLGESKKLKWLESRYPRPLSNPPFKQGGQKEKRNELLPEDIPSFKVQPEVSF